MAELKTKASEAEGILERVEDKLKSVSKMQRDLRRDNPDNDEDDADFGEEDDELSQLISRCLVDVKQRDFFQESFKANFLITKMQRRFRKKMAARKEAEKATVDGNHEVDHSDGPSERSHTPSDALEPPTTDLLPSSARDETADTSPPEHKTIDPPETEAPETPPERGASETPPPERATDGAPERAPAVDESAPREEMKLEETTREDSEHTAPGPSPKEEAPKEEAQNEFPTTPLQIEEATVVDKAPSMPSGESGASDAIPVVLDGAVASEPTSPEQIKGPEASSFSLVPTTAVEGLDASDESIDLGSLDDRERFELERLRSHQAELIERENKREVRVDARRKQHEELQQFKRSTRLRLENERKAMTGEIKLAVRHEHARVVLKGITLFNAEARRHREISDQAKRDGIDRHEDDRLDTQLCTLENSMDKLYAEVSLFEN